MVSASYNGCDLEKLNTSVHSAALMSGYLANKPISQGSSLNLAHLNKSLVLIAGILGGGAVTAAAICYFLQPYLMAVRRLAYIFSHRSHDPLLYFVFVK